MIDREDVLELLRSLLLDLLAALWQPIEATITANLDVLSAAVGESVSSVQTGLESTFGPFTPVVVVVVGTASLWGLWKI